MKGWQKNMIKIKIQQKVKYDDLFEELENKSFGLLKERENKAVSTDTGETVTVTLPKFVPNESWGNPDSESYKIMEPFVLRASGASSDLQKKINNLSRIFDKAAKIESPGRIISSLIVAESFASILNSFSESSAGFVFEGFLAALTFGKQVTERTPTGLPIEDIIAFDQNGPNGRPASLKLLKGSTYRPSKRGTGSGPDGQAVETKGTPIHGSYQNLVYFFDRYDAIDYIVCMKRGNVLEMTVYELSKNNVVDFLVDTGNGHLLGWGDLRREVIKNKDDWNQLRPLLYQTIGKKAPELTTDDSGDLDTPERELNEARGSQWGVTQENWRRLPGFKVLATLDLSTNNLKDLNQYWSTKLNKDIKVLFNNMDQLSKNVNLFYANDDRSEAKKFGTDAIGNTNNIKKSLSESTDG